MLAASQVRDGSLGGAELGADSVSGVVDESSLGRVAAASSADRGASAGNADALNGQIASDQKVRWFLLDEQGAIEDQSGGFTVIDAHQTNQNAYVDTGESLVSKGIFASLAVQNQIDSDGDGTLEPTDAQFSGQVTATRCQIPQVVEGAATADGARKRSTLPLALEGQVGDRSLILLQWP